MVGAGLRAGLRAGAGKGKEAVWESLGALLVEQWPVSSSLP